MPDPFPSPDQQNLMFISTPATLFPSPSNVSRDRGLRSFLEGFGSVLVLFFLSWRLAPVCSIVIVFTAVAAALFRKYTRDIEQRQGKSLQRMSAVAYQALDNMKVVRWVSVSE